MMRRLDGPGAVLAAAAALVGLAGCGTLPPPPALEDDPALVALAAKTAGAPRSLRLAIAPPVPPERTYDLEAVPGVYGADFPPAAFQEAIAAAIGRFTGFRDPVTLATAARPAAFEEALAKGADVVVFPTFRRSEAYFVERNSRWAWNIALYIYFWIPSWWVRDEDYGIRADVDLAFHGVASERLLDTRRIAIDERRSLDDFERGWSVFGTISVPSSLDADDMKRVGATLLPYGLRALERAAALEVGKGFAETLASPEVAEQDATVHALLVGVSRHAESAIEGRATASAGVAAVRSFLETEHAVPPKNIVTLVDAQARRKGVLEAAMALARRARPQDTVLVYWAGGGGGRAPARAEVATGVPAAKPALAPFDSSEMLPVEALVEAARAARARRILIVLDAPVEGASDAELARLTAGTSDVALFLATGPGERARDFAEAGRGLFTFMLLDGARGWPERADSDRDGRTSLEELGAYVARKVADHAGLEGASQTPRLFRGGTRAAGRTGDEPWLPGVTARGDGPATSARSARAPSAR